MKRLLEAWPLLAWMTLAVVVAVLLIGCGTTTQAAQRLRFVVVYQQRETPAVYVLKDKETGTCWIGYYGLAEAPKEVCEVSKP